MECREFERMIPAFLDNKLDYPTLKRFREHVDCCGECREELVIQFLVTEGIQRLENGSAFDLQKELNDRLEEAERKIRFHGGFMRLGLAMEIVSVCILAGILLWILL